MQEISPFLKKLKQNTTSISAFKIYIGLTASVEDLGVHDYEIFVNPEYNMESMYQYSVSNEFENVPYSITSYSSLTDTFCGNGKSVISIGALSGYDYWHSLSREEYIKKKEDVAELLLARAEKVLPRLTKYIKTKVVATPLTMERYTGNSRGAAYGWNKKSVAEEIAFMNPTTPIKNLFLSSHWTKMGGGIGGVLLSSDRVYDLFKKSAMAGVS